jgi:4-amino-4-deoxy-L-arabinose transferase-like glycosyltransferase
MKNSVGWMLIILIIGFLLRIVEFGELPLSLNRDEAALGYNAFSLVKEGVDEWGEPWPVAFKSFGDYKLPGYIYSLIPLIAAFGLTDWVVRLPSLLAGLVNIWLVYLIAKKTFPKANWIGILAALYIAVSPWAIYYSRVGFEAHLALSFTLGLILLLLTQKARPINTYLALGLMFLSVATYNSPLILMPFIIMSFVWLNRKNKGLWPLFLGFLLIMVLGIRFLFDVSSAKTGITIFSDPTIATEYRERRVSLTEKNPFLGPLLGNRPFFYGTKIAQRYVNSFSPEFLVIKGGTHPWHQIPNAGHFGWSAYLLFIFGFVTTLTDKQKTSNQKWLVFLLLVSLIPSIITVDAPHATRSLLFFALVVLFAGVGSEKLLSLSSKKWRSWLLVGLIFFETLVYVNKYFIEFPKIHAASWKVGLKESINQIPTGADKVVITEYYSSPYIYVLFYEKILPSQFQSNVKYYPPDNSGLMHVMSFGRYQFSGIISEPGDGVLITQEDNGEMVIIK